MEGKQLTIQKIIDFNTRSVPKQIFDSLISSTTLPPTAIEEKNSEIWTYSYLGYGKVTFKDGSTYTGSAKYGILETEKNKECDIDFSDGTKYKGQIKNNQLTGKGSYNFPSGAIYEGEILNGLRHGYGKYKSKDGITYEGEWKDGKKEGNGIIVKDDMTYEGSFSKGVINGYGKLYWSNGNIYEGNFDKNLINGNGTMIWMDSNQKYTGQWNNNLQNGFGIHIWYDNNLKGLRNRYVGQWKNGLRNGYGVFFYANGCKYEGFWENNLKSGFGIYRFKNGSEYIGRFELDRMMDYQNEGIVEVTKDKNEYFSHSDYKKNDGNDKKKGLGFLEKKSKKIELPKIENGKSKNLDLEIIMENDNGKKGKDEKKNEKNKNNDKEKEKDKEKDKKGKKGKKIPSEEFKIEEVIQIPTTNILENEIYYSSKRVIQENEKNQYLTLIDISDILELQENYTLTLKEISNSILRNITDLKKSYSKLLKINIDDPDYFFFNKMGSTFTNNLNDDDGNNINTNNNNNNQKDDKIGVYLELKDMWKFLRENGIIDQNFSIAQFDRIFYRGKKNIEEMFLVPDNIPRIQIYDYIYLMIKKSLRQFKNKYENYVKFSQKEKEIFEKHIQEKNSLKDINLIPNEKEKKNLDTYFNEEIIDPSLISFNYHNYKNTLQVHQFIEAIIRIAYLKYINLNIPFNQKIDNVINKFVIKKTKEKDRLNSKIEKSNLLKSALMHDTEQLINRQTTEQKQKATEHIFIDNLIQKYEIILKSIFLKLYHHQNELSDFKYDRFNKESNEDMTLTHKFIYKNLVLKSDIIKEFYGNKESYCNYIVYYFKEKKTEFKDNKEKYDYYEDLFDIELIFYEFCEFIYFASSKYFDKYNLNVDDEKNYANFFNHLFNVIETNYDFNNRKIIFKAKSNYCMPVLKQHIEKQTMIDSNLRKTHLEYLKRFEKLRVAKERRNMQLEEYNAINAFIVEEEEEEEDSEDY